MAQKWRAFKTIARFAKNPVAYGMWKFASLHNQNRIRFMWGIMFFQLYFTTKNYIQIRRSADKQKERFYWAYGLTSRNYMTPINHIRMPRDRHKCYVRYSNFHQMKRNKRAAAEHMNWWCRDQCFRKYFEMRKKNGIKPSLTGFYDDAIYAKSRAIDEKYTKMRQDRAAYNKD